MYKYPSWYKNKKLDLEAVTDAQLEAIRHEVLNLNKINAAARQDADQRLRRLLADAIALLGEKAEAVRKLRQTSFDPIPDLVREYGKFESRVYAARKQAVRRAKRREYNRAYYRRKKLEREGRADLSSMEA